MKKLIILILLSLISCAPVVNHVPMEVKPFVIDFTKYTESGFLFTPLIYQGDYESKGIISIEVYPEANLKGWRELSEKQKEKFKNMHGNKIWIVDEIRYQQVIDYAYKLAIKLDADAIMQFELKNIEKEYNFSKSLTIQGLEISGFAIKRKGKFE